MQDWESCIVFVSFHLIFHLFIFAPIAPAPRAPEQRAALSCPVTGIASALPAVEMQAAERRGVA